MAKQFSKCLGVDIGSSSVKIAECSLERGGIRVNKLLRIDLPAFPDAEAAETGTAKIIKDALKENKIATREAVFSLGGQQIFSRRVRLPEASEERLQRIVEYEARQQIPFPEDKTKIEHQIFRLPGEDEVEVLMVAARKDHIANFMRMVEKAGLKPIHLTVSSLALFNYMAYQMDPAAAEEGKGKKKGKKKKGKGKGEDGGEAPEMELGLDDDGGFAMEETKAFLNIGESHTDLVIARKARSISLAFIRSIPIAGREFSRYIQNACSLESLAEAERLKRQSARAFPPDETIPNDPNLDAGACEALSDIIDSRLARQIQLSLDYFIAQPDGTAVEELIVSGGSARIEGLPEVLEDRLGMTATRLQQPGIPELQLGAPLPAPMASFAVCVGQAITGLGRGRVVIDFLPERYKTILVFPKAQVAGMTAALGAMVFMSTAVGTSRTGALDNEAILITSQADELRPQKPRLEAAEKERVDLNAAMDSFLKAFDAQGRDRLTRFYADLVKTVRSVEANIILDSFEVDAYGAVLVRGQADASVAAPDLSQAMTKRLADYLDPDNPPRLEGNASNQQNNVYSFEIRAQLLGKVSRIAETPAIKTAGGSGDEGGGRRPIRPGGARPRR